MVLSAGSPYFETALGSGFQENVKRDFRFEEYSSNALWRVFQYMYTDAYDEEGAQDLSAEGKHVLSRYCIVFMKMTDGRRRS